MDKFWCVFYASQCMMRGMFVCLSVCQTSLVLSVLQGRGPRPRRLSPWALGTCVPTLLQPFHPCSLREKFRYRVMKWTRHQS